MKSSVAYANEYENELRELSYQGISKWDMYLKHRERLVHKYAWAIPHQYAIREICEHGPIIELGAGSGYWAYLVDQAGTEIVCFDDKSWVRNDTWAYEGKTWHSVNTGSHEKLADYPNHTLMLCWPNYGDSFALESLKAYQGEYLIYIGEPYSGCTGCDEFHNLLGREWTEERKIWLEQWDGIHDELVVYKRRCES